MTSAWSPCQKAKARSLSQRNRRRAANGSARLVLGILAIMAIYLSVNVAYMLALPINESEASSASPRKR